MVVDASVFFEQLEQFTALWVRRFVDPDLEPSSPWHCEQWTYGQPTGAVIHFTADPDPVRVARWLLDHSYNTRVSAHAMILPRWTDETRELARGFPAVSALSAPVLQFVDPNSEAWHATWANEWAYGIENVYVGEVQCRGGNFFWWRPRDRSAAEWTSRWTADQGEPMPILRRWWCPYPKDQVQANIELLRWLNAYFDGSLNNPAMVIGHEHVQEAKSDPGPAFPLHAVRRGLLPDSYDGPVWDDTDLMHGQTWRDEKVREWYSIKSPQKAWAVFSEDVNSQQVRVNQWDLWGLTLLSFELLGYVMGQGTNDTSIRLFQRCMAVKADGIVGPITWRALKRRLKDQRLIR